MRPLPTINSVVAACLLALSAAAYAAPVDPDTGRVFAVPRQERGPAIPYATATMLRPYSGLGTWADVYDWSRAYGGGRVGLSTIDAMAAAGVQTLFIQTVKYKDGADVLERARLRRLIACAHSRGMDVVGWYLPSHVDERRDFRKLKAMLGLDVDGITVDIESTANKNVNARNAALIRTMAKLSAAVMGSGRPIAIGAATYPPHVLDRTVRMWPDFPWDELSQYVHVWLPMSYWSQFIRSKHGMGDARALTADTMTRLRGHLGSDARIHVIGGSGMDPTQVSRMINQIRVTANPPIGASLYDWRVTSTTSRRTMRALSELRNTRVPAPTDVASSANATVSRSASGSAQVVWWSPDSSIIKQVDVGGQLASQPTLAFYGSSDRSYIVAARIKRIGNRDDWRGEYPAYIRMARGAATGTWREVIGAPHGCNPAISRIDGKRMLAACTDDRGVVSFAYLRDGSSKWSRWVILAGLPELPPLAPISVASAGSTATLAWVAADSTVQVATWRIGTRKASVQTVVDTQSRPIHAINTAALLNPVSANALSLTFSAAAGAYRVPISVDNGVTMGKSDWPTIAKKLAVQPAAIEFADAGFALVNASSGTPTWMQP